MTQTLIASGITAAFDPQGGSLFPLTVTDEGAEVAPLHARPLGAGRGSRRRPPHQRRLRGDFLAAPLGPAPTACTA
jgi:hypothetical protein